MHFAASVIIWYQETNKGDFMLMGLLYGLGFALLSLAWTLFSASVEQIHNNKAIEIEKARNATKEVQNDNNL